MKNILLGNLVFGAVAFVAVSACSDDSGSTTSSTAAGGGSSTSSAGGAAGSGGAGGSSSTTNGGSAGTGGSGSSAGGSGGAGGAAGSGGSGGAGGSTAGAAGSGGAGGAAGSSGAAGSGGAGGSGDGGVACNVNPGKALQFDGTAVDMMTADLGMELPGGDVPRTIELWAKFLGAQSWQAEHTIIETGLKPAGGAANMLLGIDMSGDMDGQGPRQFGPYTNGYSDNNRAGNGMGGVVVPGIAQTGWFHLSWSYTGNHGTFHFTVDGKEYPVITQGGQATMSFGPGIVTLGASQSFGFPGWAGVMDEVRVWKVARTAQQISDNMRVVLKPTEPGLVAYYRFSEGSGAFSDDESMTMGHRISTCTAASGRCARANTASPMWVASDIPGTFTCAP